MKELKKILQLKRKKRVRSKISGTAECPRCSVYKSNRVIYVQLINDLEGKTIGAVSSIKEKKKNMEIAEVLGKKIGEIAKEKKIKKCVFDRGANKYHGVIKVIADSARNTGLNF